jgi:alkylresorcinol/alkylpyrone synthase
MGAMPQANLIALATAVPPYVLTQEEVARHAARVYAPRMPDYDRLQGIFLSTGIKERRSARPIEWYLEPRGWPERTAAYLEVAGHLFVEAAEAAMRKAGVRASDIDTIVTVSSTGVATPSLEARIAGRIGFREGVSRVPVFGLGCAGGVSGLSIAARLAEARPGSNVLLVVVELCTLSVRLDKADKANLVAVALFGDGAAACLLRAGEKAPIAVEGAGERTWPETLGIMGWSVDPEGLGVIFDRAIPPFAEEHLGAAVDAILAELALSRAEINRFVCHPGGTKVVAAIESALALPAGSLTHERAVLARFGNMSAPTALFVLERVLADGMPDRIALSALGPGFTLSCASLRRAA